MSRAWALPIVDNDLRLDVPIETADGCVLWPEASAATEGCDGIDREEVGKRFLAGFREGVEPVSFILATGEPLYVVNVLRDPTSSTELDRAGANEFARVIRARVSGQGTPVPEGSPGAREPWEERINGVQVVGFDATTDSDDDQALNHHLFYVASTSRGAYTISFTCATSDAEEVRAIGRETLSTLRAAPAKPAKRRPDAAARAGAIGDAIYYALVALAQLVGVVLVVVAIVRNRRKAREQATPWRQPPP
ncbi:MAG: hypothetical protein KF850_23430 [Labilithrix sp.]|nr:hypothetical protein [Labilithrix sp.]